jgi:hypothetical protein
MVIINTITRKNFAMSGNEESIKAEKADYATLISNRDEID